MLIPDNPHDLANTTWTPVVNAQELYDTLIKEGQTHYHQATETPLITGPIADKIRPFDDSEYCNTILNGTFNWFNLAMMPEVKEIVSGMRYPDPTTNPNPHI